ncbi:MAG: stage III sporulation protein AB [Thermoanaerobacteraceae bacterium]|nr:stage III sporulation protein AB [Thermoanaerobacteraceae bacterium]
MVKLVGAVLVLGSCSYAGISFGRKYTGRVEQLRQLISALQLLQSEIDYTSTPILEVLPVLAQHTARPVACIFLKMETRLKNGSGYTAGEAWQEALDTVKPQLSLTKFDLEILYRLGTSMGSSGKEEQVKNLQLAKQQLSYQEREAAAERIRYERLYKTMGFLVGLALVLAFV